MKKITITTLAATLICALLMTPPAFAWEVYLHDDIMPCEYRLNKLPNPIGQSSVYKGKAAYIGVEIQDCVAFYNPAWKSLMITLLENDDYYGATLIGPWGVTDGFIWSHTGGFTGTGYNVYMGPLTGESAGGDAGDASNAR